MMRGVVVAGLALVMTAAVVFCSDGGDSSTRDLGDGGPDSGLADGATGDSGTDRDGEPPRDGAGSDATPADDGGNTGDGGGSSGDGGGDTYDASPAPDGGSGAECPGHSEMVLMTGLEVCIDAYEASQPESGDAAQSVAGVLPWASVSWGDARDACTAAGKRLCTHGEWRAACHGADGRIYSWGQGDDPDNRWDDGGRCNDRGHSAGEAVNTGSMTQCEGGFANLFDMSGNVREWTSTCVGDACLHAGGSYHNGVTESQCEHSALSGARGYTNDRIGFRCCLDVAGNQGDAGAGTGS